MLSHNEGVVISLRSRRPMVKTVILLVSCTFIVDLIEVQGIR